MKLDCVIPRSCKRDGHKRRTFLAAVAGAKRFGLQTNIINNYESSKSDMVLTWGGSVNGIHKKLKPSQIWMHIDGGFLNRPDHVRISLNDYYSDKYIHNFNLPSDRFDSLNIHLKPWRRCDGKILICCSSKPGMARVGLNLKYELNSLLINLNKFTDREISIRHKNAAQTTKLYDILNGVSSVIAWNSAASIEAAIAGVPIFTMCSSVADPIANKDLSLIENPKTFNREQCLYNIAYHQWTDDEISTGDPFNFLLSNYLVI